MMTEDKPEEGTKPMCVNDRTAVESIASILRHLVTNGLIQPDAARRTMAGSTASLSNPLEIDLWRKAATQMETPLVKH
jgi:hypothetical protein